MTTFHSTDPAYWDRESLLKEEQRIFGICHGCRLCFNLCPSFPALFDITDPLDGDLSKTGLEDYRAVEELCYQCKLCYVRCPYTPPHNYNLDFPRVMMRHKLIRTKKEGVKWQDRLLGDTDLLGRVGGMTAPIANVANKLSPNRVAIELVLDIHRKAEVPRFHRRSFASWARKHLKAPAGGQSQSNGKVALFYTCSVNYNDPDVGKACIDVLKKSNLEVAIPEQQCCGMPFLDGGDIKRARKKMEHNLSTLAKMVDQGYDIVVPGPTCSFLLKQEYPSMTGGSEEARKVSERTFEVGEYLLRLHREKRLNTDFKKKVGKIAFHAACHTRAQFIGNPSADILSLVSDSDVKVIERCSGHDGTWGMKKRFHDISLQVGERLFKTIGEAAPDLTVTDCPLASMQIHHATRRRPVHTAQVLREAYGIP